MTTDLYEGEAVPRTTVPVAPSGPSSGLALRAATKAFSAESVFDGLDLEVENGSFTVLVGPSGCGKSTCLRTLAGLETLDSGQVLIGGVDVTGSPARSRGLSMVFQDFALYPNMTVEGNVSFALRLQAKHDRRSGLTRAEIRRRCADVMSMLELEGLAGRRPSQLSGGQRQRVALARAIVRRPQAFLMDEPLSGLDAQLRAQTRTQLVRLHRTLGTTFLYVTHDQVEAMSMATRLVVMDRGRIVQQGTPDEVYANPANRFVATFIGSPRMNLASVTVSETGAVSGDGIHGVLDAAGPAGSRTIGWRPSQAVALGANQGMRASEPGLSVHGRVDVVENLGEHRLVTAIADGGASFSALLGPQQHPGGGEKIDLWVPESAVHGFHATTGDRLSLSE